MRMGQGKEEEEVEEDQGISRLGKEPLVQWELGAGSWDRFFHAAPM
jgi:hypothetical protein